MRATNFDSVFLVVTDMAYKGHQVFFSMRTYRKHSEAVPSAGHRLGPHKRGIKSATCHSCGDVRPFVAGADLDGFGRAKPAGSQGRHESDRS